VLRFMLRSFSSYSAGMPDRFRDPAPKVAGRKDYGRSASDVGPDPGVIKVGH
jgi:hypothetical protein